ncbi:MAG: ABC transporter permease, partial [Candidatus Bathyarchaeota archaeon]
MSLKRSLNQIAAIAKTDFLGVLRNKTAIFFTLLFPLFFIVIIGFTFGQTGETTMSRISVGVINLDGELVTVNATDSFNSTIGDLFVKGLGNVNFTVTGYGEYGDRDTNGTAAYAISRGDIDAILIIPANFTETLTFQYTDSVGVPVATKSNLELKIDPTDTTGALITQQSVFGFISGFIKEYQNIALEQAPPDMKTYIEVVAD